jgi:hypothetical protein
MTNNANERCARASAPAERKCEMEKKSLFEITRNHEAGIVVRENTVTVCNWSSYEAGLPVLDPTGSFLMEWPSETGIIVKEERSVNDVRDELPGRIAFYDDAGNEVDVKTASGEITYEVEDMDIVYDRFGDIEALWGIDTEGGAQCELDDDGNLVAQSGSVWEIECDGESAVIIVPDNWN